MDEISLVPPTLAIDSRSLDVFHMLLRDAHRAARHSGVHTRHRYRVGGAPITVDYVGDGVEEALAPAIAHLETSGADDSPQLSITAWVGTAVDQPLTPALRAVINSCHSSDPNRPYWLNTRHEIEGLQSDDLHATFQWPVVSLFAPAAAHAIWYVDDLEQLQIWDRSAPFRSILSWWIAGQGHMLVHAAAVGRPEGALLLTGRGGSGKSTAALSCVGSELQYLGDDYCGVRVEPAPGVFSLYNSGKLVGEPDFERLPHLVDWIVNPDELGDMKQLVFVHDHAPEAVLDEAPLLAIVVPTIADVATPELVSESPAEVLRALAPTSLFQLPGTGKRYLAQVAGLTRNVPCYRLLASPDLARNRRLLDELVDRLSART